VRAQPDRSEERWVLVTTLLYGQAPAETPQMHEGFEAGLAVARAKLGGKHPFIVGGKPRDGERTRPEWSPIDSELVIGSFAQASAADVDEAVEIASGFATLWGLTDPLERVAIVRRAIEIMEQRKTEIIAVSVLETAKNRIEAFGEVEELIGLVRLNCDQVEENDGFRYALPETTVGFFPPSSHSAGRGAPSRLR
jgi:1-pyrroline-5-carboxylate dehydrogenase